MVQGILGGDFLSIISLASSFISPGLGTALAGSLRGSVGFNSAVTSGILKSFAAGILSAGSLTEIAKSVAFQLGKGALVASLSSKIVETIDDKFGTGNTSSAKSFKSVNAARFAVLYNAASPFLEKRGSGGPIRGSRSYLVGEQGPETFVPGRSGSISPSMNPLQIVDAAHEVRDEMSAIRRQFGRALSGGELADARV